MKNIVLWSFVFLILFVYSQGEKHCRTRKNTRPNIVLVIADDLGWNDVGWHNTDVITPHMDRMARHGVILENSYVQPLCTPSRAAILTGKYPHRLGLQWLAIYPYRPSFLPKDAILLPEVLKNEGYNTHLVGKWHLGHCNKDLFPTNRGFDTFYGLATGATDFYTRNLFGFVGYDFWENTNITYPPEGSYNTDLFTERSIEIIKSSSDESPFFLQLAHASPHFPLQVPGKYTDMYPNVEDSNRRAYLGMVTSLDESVGKVVQALEDNDLMDNTVVIFISDNGGMQMFGGDNYPLRGEKSDLWEGGVKSVGFVYSPKLLDKPGCYHHGMIHAVDWFSTILDIAGCHKNSQPRGLDSRSQWSFIRKCHGSARKEMILSIDDYVSHSAAIRYGNYKLILGEPVVVGEDLFNPQPTNPNSTDIRLYNLKSDPFESKDISKQLPHIVHLLLRKLDHYRKYEIPAQDPQSVPAEEVVKDGVFTTGWC